MLLQARVVSEPFGCGQWGANGPMGVGSNRFRLFICTYAPRGGIVRVDGLTKHQLQAKHPPEKLTVLSIVVVTRHNNAATGQCLCQSVNLNMSPQTYAHEKER